MRIAPGGDTCVKVSSLFHFVMSNIFLGDVECHPNVGGKPSLCNDHSDNGGVYRETCALHGCLLAVRGALRLRRNGDVRGRIVYVSCNPATLVRDAFVLVHAKNYCMRPAGVVNMFLHISHVESIVVFGQELKRAATLPPSFDIHSLGTG